MWVDRWMDEDKYWLTERRMNRWINRMSASFIVLAFSRFIIFMFFLLVINPLFFQLFYQFFNYILFIIFFSPHPFHFFHCWLLFISSVRIFLIFSLSCFRILFHLSFSYSLCIFLPPTFTLFSIFPFSSEMFLPFQSGFFSFPLFILSVGSFLLPSFHLVLFVLLRPSLRLASVITVSAVAPARPLSPCWHCCCRRESPFTTNDM